MLDVRATLDPARRDDIEAIVARHRTLEDVARWALSHRPPLIFPDARTTREGDADAVVARAPGFDIVVQDEFNHDVTVPFDVRGELFLVYDTT